MSIEYEFIGWCREGTHDKVWGVIKLREGDQGHWGAHDFLTFWGRRGRKLQTKVSEDDQWHIENLIEAKKIKGYQEIESDKLNEVYPEFEQDLEKTAFWSMFKV